MLVCVDVSAAVRGGVGAAESPVEGAEGPCQGTATRTPEATPRPDKVNGELLQRPSTVYTHTDTHTQNDLFINKEATSY